MKILVIGGTKFFGIHMVWALLENGHDVTIATRGYAKDPFGDKVSRILLDHSDPESMKAALSGKHFDVAIDKIAYCSNDIKYLMDAVSCDRLIYVSSTAVYNLDHMDVKEDEFNGNTGLLKWCNRPDASYAEVKRQAEYALWKEYSDKKWLTVRYPFVVGTDDYTKRLLFYVEHVIKGTPMQIDNPDAQMSFIRSDEAGKFLAFLTETEMTGAVNGCSGGTVSLREILNYIEEKTGKTAVLSSDGDAAPYNGNVDYSINTDKAKMLGYEFSNVRDWMFELIDEYIRLCTSKKRIAFICVHNSCRSQIAEALGKKYLSEKYECYSAGTETKPQINQDAVRIMKDMYDIDMEQNQYSKLISDIPLPDIAISMGCNVSCPFIGRGFDDDWGLEDPTGKSDEEFVKVIKEIERKILEYAV